MSEPARSHPPHEPEIRAAPGPLRDWLAAMKAHAGTAPAAARQEVRQEVRHEVREDVRAEVRPDARPLRVSEATWGPRLVQAADAPATGAQDEDVSQLMAENLMLKAKLQLENDRQGELQGLLAAQIRDLRDHIEQEMGSLEDLRSDQEEIRIERDEFRAERDRFRREREELRAERDAACSERDGLRADRQALDAERDRLREERDLWRARTEALASPLFQPSKR